MCKFIERALLITLVISGSSHSYSGPETFSMDVPTITLKISHPHIGWVTCDNPEFPVDKYGNSLEGEVLLSLLIGTDGKPEKVSISESSGDKRIDNASIKNAKCGFFGESIGQQIETKFVFESAE